MMHRFKAWLHKEWRHLTTLTPSDRPWQMPAAAALACGLPLAVAAAFDRLHHGLAASLGGLVFMYLPATCLPRRMRQLAVCTLGMGLAYSLGLLCHFIPWSPVPVLGLIALFATMLTRRHAVGPPGALFFVMTAAIGACTPVDVRQIPLMAGLFGLGELLACLIALVYSVIMLRYREAKPAPRHPEPTFDYIVFDSVIIGVSVSLSLALAQSFRLEKSYWVPVACLAVIQGTTLRAVWNRQVHRILGTTLGLLPAWAILALPLNPWTIAALVTVLMFIIETTVVRHYAVAAMFITPLGILLAEAAALSHTTASSLVAARFFDTAMGAFVGFLGGVCLHSPRFRKIVGNPLRWMLGVKQAE